MATRKEYAYQIKGSRLALLEKDVTTGDDGLNYTYTAGDGIDVPSGAVAYKSPLANVVDGLEIEFVYTPEFLDGGDEASTIDLPSYLCKALVCYVKAKVSEDSRDIEGKEYYIREFRKMIEKHESAKIAGPRRVMPGVGAIR